MEDEIKVRASIAPWRSSVELWFRQGRSYGVSLSMQVMEDRHIWPVDPTVRISIEEAQALMDSLWDCGIRPTEGTGSAGAMRAVESHVSDLRKIAFKSLGISEK